MNFAPFSGHIPTATSLPTIHQFAAKFGYEGTGNGTASSNVVQETRYQSSGTNSGVQFVSSVDSEGVKFRQGDNVVVVSNAQPAAVALASIAPIPSGNTGLKYHSVSSSSVNLGNIAYGGHYVQETVVKERSDKREYREEVHQDLMTTMMQQQMSQPLQQGQQLVVVLHEPKEAAVLARALKHDRTDRLQPTNEYISIGDVSDASSWQSLGGGVADYLSALPLPLHHLLKYSAPADDKRDDQPTVLSLSNSLPMPAASVVQTNSVNSLVIQTASVVNQLTADTITTNPNTIVVAKKKKKKKSVKEKKPRPIPGEIRLTTALDGSTLYCCPECHMAYPERELLEQHLLGHTMERRFICDICNAALKRKDHLTRHKQSHNPERPHVCSVCLKAFKRKEQLTLHFIIHSGEKRHICNECGKGFYRKDHLRKHTRSHIARRVKAELSQRGSPAPTPTPTPTPAPADPALDDS